MPIMRARESSPMGEVSLVMVDYFLIGCDYYA